MKEIEKIEESHEGMNDYEFHVFCKLLLMVLDGCKDLDEAKAKIQKLLEE